MTAASPKPSIRGSVPRRRAGRSPEIIGLPQLTADLKSSVRILIVDDDDSLRDSCASVLRYEGYQVTVCGRGDEARDLFKRNKFDIVLLDVYLPEIPGLTLLRRSLDLHPETIVIMMTGNPSVESSLEALRSGAWDYLPKPFSGTHLQILIGRAAHAVIVARESHALQAAFDRENGNSDLITVLGAAPSFRRAMDMARRVAPTDASVFITGESGSGKELIAQFIHRHSRRSSRPLIAINCAALPEALLESEMFGHVKGSFTGAVRDKGGLLEAANGGTLLLDELAEMSKPIQAKLLRAIQDGVVRRVGSETTDAVVNVRFIASTNRNPEEAVASGALRQDLYYRLRVVPIHVPPLRERPGDIKLLAEHFLSHYWGRHRGATAALPTFSDAAIRALRARPWQGNVRELQNVIEHLVVLLDAGTEIHPDDIPALEGASNQATSCTIPCEVSIDEPYYQARDRLVAEFELQYLTQLVNQVRGNMSRAARVACVDRTSLYRLLERHGLHRRVPAETAESAETVETVEAAEPTGPAEAAEPSS